MKCLEEKDTRERILEAASQVFGKDGFKAATVRRICQKAGANVAAVNYYFKDKQGLYLAVIEQLFEIGFKKIPIEMGLDPDMKPKEKLRIFIRNFFLRLTLKKGCAGFESRGRLMLRELSDPSPVLDHVAEKYFKPHKEVLFKIILELLGPKASQEQIIRCCLSVVGQCTHYNIARPIMARVAGQYILTEKDLEKVADHIWRFSLGGIENIRKNI